MECELCTENDNCKEGIPSGEAGKGSALAVKVTEVQNMARHVLRNALVLWVSQGTCIGRATRAR
jgi:hypothetical protein